MTWSIICPAADICPEVLLNLQLILHNYKETDIWKQNRSGDYKGLWFNITSVKAERFKWLTMVDVHFDSYLAWSTFKYFVKNQNIEQYVSLCICKFMQSNT